MFSDFQPLSSAMDTRKMGMENTL